MSGQDEFTTFAHDGVAVGTSTVDIGPFNEQLSRTWRVDQDDGGNDTSASDSDGYYISNISV